MELGIIQLSKFNSTLFINPIVTVFGLSLTELKNFPYKSTLIFENTYLHRTL